MIIICDNHNIFDILKSVLICDNLWTKKTLWTKEKVICGQIRYKKAGNEITSFSLCDSGGIQTHNLLIRSQMLYSVELRSQSVSDLRLQRYAVFFTCATIKRFFYDFFVLATNICCFFTTFAA